MNASLTSPSIVLARRNAIPKILAGFAAIAASSASLAQTSEQPAGEMPCISPNQARTSIHYVLDFNASPERFYHAIVDAKHFAEFSGMPATIDANAGGAISMFGGLIQGRNIELVPNQRIVQAWRSCVMGTGSLFRLCTSNSSLGAPERASLLTTQASLPVCTTILTGAGRIVTGAR